MKTIIVRWIPEMVIDAFQMDMQVIESDHPIFTKGTRFDFGFFRIATREGYTIVSLPK